MGMDLHMVSSRNLTSHIELTMDVKADMRHHRRVGILMMDRGARTPRRHRPLVTMIEITAGTEAMGEVRGQVVIIRMGSHHLRDGIRGIGSGHTHHISSTIMYPVAFFAFSIAYQASGAVM